MPLNVSKTFDVLQEGLLSDEFYEDCWPTALPAAQLPPTATALQGFDALLADDAAVVALDVSARARLREAALGIERRIPFLSSSGAALPAPHRLFLALEAAKLLRCRPAAHDDLARLASVVVYPGVTKLRRGHTELGVLLMRGPYRLLPHLASLERVVALFLDVSVHGGGALKAWRRGLRDFKGDCRRWCERITPGDALVGLEEAFGDFIARGRALFADDLKPLRRAPALANTIAAQDINLKTFADGVTVVCDSLEEASDALTLPAQASIHLSWATQLACHTTASHDTMVHELAHLVDFAHGGIDGLPVAPGVGDEASSSLAKGWAAAWEALEGGSYTFLDAYARKNPAELFAVATEAFFTDSVAVRAGSPSLAQLLEDTWGYTPVPRTRRSGFWVGRQLIFSKLSGTFE